MNDFNGFEGRVITDLATIKEHLANQPCKKHDETIFGNGSMGLKTQVKVLWLIGSGAWVLLLGYIFR